MQTTQEYFNDIATHLLKQNRRSEDDDGSDLCRYRGPDGLKCAIGCKIPDDIYDKSMEGVVVEHLLKARPELKPFLEPGEVTRHGRTLNQQLQSIHDLLANTGSWRNELKRLAKIFGLEMPKI